MLAERGDDPALAIASAQELAAELAAGADSALPAVLTALSRPTRLVRGQPAPPVATAVDAALFDCDAERELHAAYAAAAARVAPGMAVAEWLEVAAGLVAPVDTFFDSVFVMADDAAVRENRLALVRAVAALPRGVLDLSELPGF